MPDSELGGLLRGIVVDNNDPLKLGRVKIRVIAAYGEQPVNNLPWAWPCFPYGGAKEQGFFAVPEKGAGVYVMFQYKDGEPDPTYPVWLGQWHAQNETPSEIAGNSEDAHHYKGFKTTSGHNMIFCDKPGEEFIEIKDKHGSYIRLKDGDIEIHAERNMKLTAVRIDLN